VIGGVKMKQIISSRHEKILRYILESQKPLSIKDIALTIDVSRRTILREMPIIYQWFQYYNHPITHDQINGISFQGNKEDREKLLQVLTKEKTGIFYTPKERKIYIETELLQSNKPMKLYYFSSKLKVSPATISKDLDDVAKWLEQFQLKLNRKQGYGIEIIGNEKNKRRALVSFIHQALNGKQLKDVIDTYIHKTNKTNHMIDIKHKLLDLIDQQTMETIDEAIKDTENHLDFKFSDKSYTALAVHLGLAIKRINKGEHIQIPQDVYQYVNAYDEFEIAKKLAIQLENHLDIAINNDEVAYITLHIKGARYKSGLIDDKMINFNETIIDNFRLTVMIKKMIKYAEKQTQLKLSDDESLMLGLVDHLRPAINRLQMNLDIRNPLLEKIKETYPDIYELSLKAANIIENELNLKMPESEIGYIAMHFGSSIERLKNNHKIQKRKFRIVVTCTSGIGTSKMLAERIKNEFTRVDIIAVYSTLDLDNDWLIQNDIDFIISSVYYENPLIEVISVNPLLLKEDIDKINLKFKNYTSLSKTEKVKLNNTKASIMMINEYSNAIIEILNGFEVLTTQSNILEELLDEIVLKVKSNEKLKLDLLKRETHGSVIFEDEKVIFLHTKSIAIQSIFLLIIRNENEIKYANKLIKTAIVMLAPTDSSQEKLDVLGTISAQLISSDNLLEQIIYESENEIYKSIENILKAFMIDKNNLYLK
jgi:mannitol operon transcriptional antiterminator